MLAVDPGAILLIVGAVLLAPVIFVGGLVVAVALGWVLRDHAEATHEGSELVDLNR
jgi:hypothetical protein